MQIHSIQVSCPMQITSSDIAFSAAHSREEFRSQRVEMSVSAGVSDARAWQGLGGVEESAVISAQALALAKASAASNTSIGQAESEGIEIEPRMLMLAQIVARFFGRDVVIFVMQPPAQPGEENNPGQLPEQSFATSFSRTEMRAEFEETRFQARGLVKTADGREISLELQLNLSRSFLETVQLDVNGVERRLEDPLVINLSGTSASLEPSRWQFDLDASGVPDSLPTLSRSSGYLVLDRNGNGVIDDGREMFGALSGDGFADLRRYDSDGNGWIDQADPVFDDLRVWIGAGTADERLKSLSQLGIGALYLGSIATPFSLNDQRNEQLGQLGNTGVFLYESGQAGTVQQIDLAV